MSAEIILVVEDEAQIADVVEYVLEQDGFQPLHAADGVTGLNLFRRHKPDLVILDIALPRMSGLELFQHMRRERPDVPVVLLTCRTDEIDRVAGLEMGADDYVTKPFSPRELVARVRAVLRRVHRPMAEEPSVLKAGPLQIDTRDLRATCRGKTLRLSYQELKLLECLIRYPARIFTREALIELIYDGEVCVTDRSIDAQVKRIRKRVAEVCPDLDPIETVYGMGYRLAPELSKE